MNIKKIATLSVFTVMALTIFIVESAIPVPIPIPGIKLGLANIITLILLCSFKASDAFIVLFARIFLSAIFSGQLMSLLYSICGGIFCFIVMYLFNRFLSGHFIFLTSIFGALAHNAGQLFAAYFIVRNPGVFVYLPFLALSGVVTGLFTGLCAHYALKYLMPHVKREGHGD